MTDLPRAFRERLASEARLDTLAVDAVQESSDGTRKYRLRTWDGKFVESVYMPEEAGAQGFDPDAEEDDAGDARVRRTLCLSTQVGCAMGCGFCMTATMGLLRNLGAGEIAIRSTASMPTCAAWRPRRAPAHNLVFMGMGEPLHNYDNVVRALAILHREEGRTSPTATSP